MAEVPGVYGALRAAGAVIDPRREVVRVAGPDATTFLQGQCSQDLAALPPGSSAWSWVLQPTGKVDALVRATRISADEWLLDTDAGWAAPVAARLVRFRLRVKADIEVLDWSVVGVRGDAASAVTPAAGITVVDASWPGLAGVDLLCERAEAGEAIEAVAARTGLPVASADDWQAARIEAGIPVLGAELTERTIPGETGLIERTVSFTKGCYTGQELVARIDSRGGNVPRRLVGFRLSAAVDPGTELEGDGGTAAATITSVATSPALGPVGLGYARRGVDIGARLRHTGAGGDVEAEVVALPMVQ